MNTVKEWVLGIISELAFFGFLFYVQMFLKVDGNLWISSVILWVLLNISIVLCPVFRKCHK